SLEGEEIDETVGAGEGVRHRDVSVGDAHAGRKVAGGAIRGGECLDEVKRPGGVSPINEGGSGGGGRRDRKIPSAHDQPFAIVCERISELCADMRVWILEALPEAPRRRAARVALEDIHGTEGGTRRGPLPLRTHEQHVVLSEQRAAEAPEDVWSVGGELAGVRPVPIGVSIVAVYASRASAGARDGFVGGTHEYGFPRHRHDPESSRRHGGGRLDPRTPGSDDVRFLS